MSRLRPSFVTAAIAGTCIGVAAFAVEGALLMSRSAMGLDVDVSGPYAALIQIVRPLVPPLLAKVGIAYVAAGAAGGLLVGAWVRLLSVRRRRSAAAWFLVGYAALVLLLCLDRAIVRPALFDGVPRVLVDGAEPWMPRTVAAFLLLLAALAALVRRRLWERPLMDLGPVVLLVLSLFASGTVLWAPTFPGEAPASPARPRDAQLVLLFGIDAFRPDRLRAFGGSGEVAPNLEAFLEDATVFSNAWTPIAQTEPAWRALLTARWPHRTGVRYPLTAESRWQPSPTFAATFAEAGWRTTFATDCSRFHYEPSGAGFTQRHQPPRGAINFVLEKLRFRLLGVFADNEVGAWALPEIISNRALAGLHDPVGYADRLAEAIIDATEDGPALFAFHATAAHFPGDPVYPHYRRFVRKDAPLHRRLRMYFSPITGAKQARRQEDWTREDAEALYDELLGQADAQLGLVLSRLQARGLYDEATIVVFSDHGESFHADHPALSGATPVHGARLGEEENRILLAVKLPKRSGVRQPRQVDALVRLIDIGPTLLDVAGLGRLEGVDGESLLPLLRGEPAPPRRLLAETGYTHASPAAFDPGHLAVAPRSFEVYRVRRDGVVELDDAAHDAVLREKDVGAYDGRAWIIRSPRADGTLAQQCRGDCPAPALVRWLDEQLGEGTAPAVVRTHAGRTAPSGG